MIEKGNHPDIYVLADYEAGLLSAEDEFVVKAHLSDCPLCRFELKHLRRFRTIEEDKELAAVSHLKQVESKLDEGFREEIIPRFIDGKGNITKKALKSRFLKWFVPIAAAAAVILVFRVGYNPELGEGESLRGPMRGLGVEKALIILENPTGKIDTIPRLFAWKADKDFDYFLLEVFTSNLERVYQSEKIKDKFVVVPDSINALFVKSRVYIWKVKGFRGLERGAVSKNGWFKIVSIGEE